MKQEQILSNYSKMVDQSEMTDQNQIFQHNSESFLKIVSILFCMFLVFKKKSNMVAKIDFYSPFMKYGKYCFHLQFFFIANFHVLGLFIPKNQV
jgi:hypothetical protein